MRRFLVLLVSLLAAGPVAAKEIPALVYHDITVEKGADIYAVTERDFIKHLEYLKREGYQPVSLKELEAARRDETPLPAKPVLITFDDGLLSYYERALPLLKRYGFPSVVSVVTAWLDGENVPEPYQGRLMNWAQLRAIARSPFVEVISHSHDLHQGVLANAHGNKDSIVVTREYDPQTGSYESEERYRARIRADLARARARLEAELGLAPRVIAWPFGYYNPITVEEAAAQGMTFHLTLDEEPTTLERLPQVNRSMFTRYRNLTDLDDFLTFRPLRQRQLRFVELALDPFAGKPPTEQERLLSTLLSRLQLLRVNAVVLAPFTADGQRAYFRNPVLPVEADVLSRVLHRIRARLDIYHHLYLRIPVAALTHPRADEIFAELGRLNRFSGVILDKEAPAEARERVKGLLAPYVPHLRVARLNPAAATPGEHAFFEISPEGTEEAIRAQAQAALASGAAVFAVLTRAPMTSDAKLKAAMRALRQAGVRHYGYRYDDFGAQAPAVRDIVGELLGHTIVPKGRE